MKRVLFISLLSCCWGSPAQTNLPPALSTLFSIPRATLRPRRELPEAKLRPLNPIASDATDLSPSPPREERARERRPILSLPIASAWTDELQTRPPLASDNGSENRNILARSGIELLAHPDSTNSARIDSFEVASRSGGLNAFEAELYHRLEQDGCFVRREPPSENLLLRFLDSTFAPEVIRFRTVSVSCSL